MLNPKGLLEDPISKNETTILMDMEYTVDLPEGKVDGILHLKSKLDNFTIDNENNTIISEKINRIVAEIYGLNDEEQKYINDKLSGY